MPIFSELAVTVQIRNPINGRVTYLHGGDDVGDGERVIEGDLRGLRLPIRVERLREFDEGQNNEPYDWNHEDDHELEGLPYLVLVGSEYFLVELVLDSHLGTTPAAAAEHRARMTFPAHADS